MHQHWDFGLRFVGEIHCCLASAVGDESVDSEAKGCDDDCDLGGFVDGELAILFYDHRDEIWAICSLFKSYGRLYVRF